MRTPRRPRAEQLETNVERVHVWVRLAQELGEFRSGLKPLVILGPFRMRLRPNRPGRFRLDERHGSAALGRVASAKDLSLFFLAGWGRVFGICRTRWRAMIIALRPRSALAYRTTTRTDEMVLAALRRTHRPPLGDHPGLIDTTTKARGSGGSWVFHFVLTPFGKVGFRPLMGRSGSRCAHRACLVRHTHVFVGRYRRNHPTLLHELGWIW